MSIVAPYIIHFVDEHKKYRNSLPCFSINADFLFIFERAFEKYKVSYEEFCENPGIVFDNNLIILSSGHLYPVRVALPLLLGYAAFNKPVSTTALWKLATEETYRHVHFRGEASDTDADFDDLEDIGTPILTVTK